MAQIQIYQQSNLPDHLKWQIISFLRVQWPDGFEGDNLYRDWISHKEDNPVSIVLTEGNLVIAHTEVVWKMLEHESQTYKMYGLSGVFTFPSFRKKGYGMQVIKAAKEYIEKSDGDIVLFPSLQKGFYEKAGFIPMTNSTLLEGDRNNPKKNNETVFMFFLSEKGKQGKESFEKSPIYFGPTVW